MDPLIRGEYPLSMRELVRNRLPQFTKEQSELIKGSFDFIGLNYYTSNYAGSLPPSNGLNNSYSTDARANLTGESKKVMNLSFCFKFAFHSVCNREIQSYDNFLAQNILKTVA